MQPKKYNSKSCARRYEFKVVPFPSLGSKAILQHWQIMGEDHDASARDAQCSAVMCGRRDHGAAASTSSGTTGDLPEVIDRVSTKDQIKSESTHVIPYSKILSNIGTQIVNVYLLAWVCIHIDQSTWLQPVFWVNVASLWSSTRRFHPQNCHWMDIFVFWDLCLWTWKMVVRNSRRSTEDHDQQPCPKSCSNAIAICVNQELHIAINKSGHCVYWTHLSDFHNLFQLFGEETAAVSSVLLRLGCSPAGDPGSGLRLPHHPGPPPQCLWQHKNCPFSR